MHVMVLGAGVVGTTTAWFLKQAGFDVTIVDRQPAAGMETSFANGGQISVGQAEPWANPDAPRKIIKWLGHEDAPLLFRLRADAAQWRWGIRFLLECWPGRSHRHARELVRLGLESRTELGHLRRSLGLAYCQQTRGILAFFEEKREYQAALKTIDWMAELGCQRRVLGPAEAVALEPALAACADRILGAVYTTEDESGDAHQFTQHLAEHAQAAGVRWLLDHHITKLHQHHSRLTGVEVQHGGQTLLLTADAYVVALGSYSPLLLKPLGIRLPIYPVKGYSITLPVGDNPAAPTVSLTDESRKLVFSRLGDRLRVAGTAELNGYDQQLNAVRLQALEQRTLQLFPALQGTRDIVHWTGLRPATPHNVPFIGPSRLSNLFLNTGHGTLGWTLSCGSAKRLSALMSNVLRP
ncbi:D-amino-acid dehydrogenase [Chitinivorax tropicus]|uniref:D-amino-acid dehydrogenase n=1 Tax=Chitinivorax tropicus TaxID=714531 RepID=A0A840MLN5_9PROT|nr:D-amino acid dehydrogenase [Chitinivorax tropicus]MBB5019320.1 D-amino-acid dehydrogenase [Chitinivorax tropicus]